MITQYLSSICEGVGKKLCVFWLNFSLPCERWCGRRCLLEQQGIGHPAWDWDRGKL